MADCLVITKENFDSLIADSKPTLVDFWASWCGPCRMVGPIIEELGGDYEGRAAVGKVNVDEQTELAERFKVMTIPTIMVFKNGEMVEKVVGVRAKKDFAAMLDKHL